MSEDKRNTPQWPDLWLRAAGEHLDAKGVEHDASASEENDLDQDVEGVVWAQVWVKVPKAAFEEASHSAGEEADERRQAEYYGGSQPYTMEEQYQAACKQKRELDA